MLFDRIMLKFMQEDDDEFERGMVKKDPLLSKLQKIKPGKAPQNGIQIPDKMRERA